MIKIKQFTVNDFGVNAFLLIDEATKECAIVDPGMKNETETKVLTDYMAANGLHLKQIIVTHLHLDHIFGANRLKEVAKVPLLANNDDAFLGQTFEQQCRRFGIIASGTVAIDENIDEYTTLHIGNSTLQVLKVPGHSPGSVALYSPEGKFVITGDALFRESIGRTDLPGGDMTTLLESISSKLFTLPDDTAVLPGHGPLTTIGHEKKHNPFFKY